MSVRIMALVWDSGLPPNDRLVLLAIADFCDDSGTAWPSIARVAEKCGMSDRGVRKIIRRLEHSGWLETDVGGGRRGCSEYRVKPGTEFPPEHRSPGTPFPTPRNQSAENPEPGSPEPSRTVIEPSTHVPGTKLCPAQGTVRVTRFEEFWETYPHRDGRTRNRATAEKKYKAAVKRGVSEQTILDGVARAKKDRRVLNGFARDPTTWLNQRGWEDEEISRPEASRATAEQIERYRSMK